MSEEINARKSARRTGSSSEKTEIGTTGMGSVIDLSTRCDKKRNDPMDVGTAVSVTEQITESAGNNGLALTLLVVFLVVGTFCGWKTISWIAANVVVPVRDAIINHLKTTDAAMQSMERTMRDFEETLRTLSDGVKQTKLLESRVESLERQTGSKN